MAEKVRARSAPRWLMGVAFGIFVLESVAIVMINGLIGYGLQWNYSISRYVGLETWSAAVFAAGNMVVMVTMLYYLYGLGDLWKMGREFYLVVVIMSMSLIGLSACPMGYFDPAEAEYGVNVISRIHEICSRTMFATMLVLVLEVLLLAKVAKPTRIAGVVFVVYAVMCFWGFLMKVDWFARGMLVFESLYLFGFLAWCLGCQAEAKKVR